MTVVEILADIVRESWNVLGQMSPYLLLGFLVAGALSVCISPEWVERHLGGQRFSSVVKASLFGVPLPLCSCGVIPVSASIRGHGASRGATTAFLLSTPQTGVDSIAVTYALLGPVFAIFRPVAAFVTGIVGGALVQLTDRVGAADPPGESEPAPCTSECCAEPTSGSAFARALDYGLVTLPRDIGLALLVGILIAGVIGALVPQDSLAAYIGGGVLSILLLMAVGLPVYVCATASVPIAAGFMHIGASPGAALAFLIAGPATNAAAFTTIWKIMGRRAAILYLLVSGASALGCGLLLNWMMPLFNLGVPELGGHTHGDSETGWLLHAWAILLLAVLALAYKPPAKRTEVGDKTTGRIDSRDDVGDGHVLELAVSGMTCAHCAESVRRALAGCKGVRSVDVDVGRGRAVVTGEELDGGQLAIAVAESGFTARLVEEHR